MESQIEDQALIHSEMATQALLTPWMGVNGAEELIFHIAAMEATKRNVFFS